MLVDTTSRTAPKRWSSTCTRASASATVRSLDRFQEETPLAPPTWTFLPNAARGRVPLCRGTCGGHCRGYATGSLIPHLLGIVYHRVPDGATETGAKKGLRRFCRSGILR